MSNTYLGYKQPKRKRQVRQSQKKEIIYKIVNSFLSGFLVFLGAISDGNITKTGLTIAAITAISIAFTQFKDYWATQEPEYTAHALFKFV